MSVEIPSRAGITHSLLSGALARIAYLDTQEQKLPTPGGYNTGSLMATLKNEDEDDDRHEVETTGETVDITPDKKVKEPADDIEVVEDERVVDRGNEEDEEEPPQRQRETAAERRKRAKVAKERDKRELDFQRRVIAEQDARLKQLESGQNSLRVTELDTRLATALNEVQTWSQVEAKAIKAQAGEDAVEARRLREDATARANQARWEKDQLTRQPVPQPPKEPTYKALALEFMETIPWYDPGSTDEVARTVKTIDNDVARTYDPHTSKYWKELDRRLREALPEKFEDDEADEPIERPTARKGPPTGGSTRTTSAVSSNQFALSPERVRAMKDAGVWDDPVARKRYARVYANYDKEQKNSG